MLRPDREIGFCFRVDASGNKIAVTRSNGEEELYVGPGFRRLKAGDIVPKQTKAAALERGNAVRALISSMQVAEKEEQTRGSKRRWVYSLEAEHETESETALDRKIKVARRGQA